MDREKYLAGVTELYQGEVEGEGLFSTLLGTCPAEHAYGVALLLQLESEAKARLRPFLWRLGISLVENETMRAAGIEFANKLKGMSWRAAMLELAELAKPFRDRYRALEAVAPEEDKPYVSFMVAHEITVIRYAEFQAADNAKAAIEEVLNPLERSWAPQ